MAKKKPSVQITMKKVKTKEQVEKETKEIFGMSMDEIALRLPYEIKIGEEEFEIEKISTRKSFQVLRRFTKSLKSIHNNYDKGEIGSKIEKLDNLTFSDVGKLLEENVDELIDSYEELYEIFLDVYVSDEDKERFEELDIGEFTKSIPEILRIMYPSIESLVEMIRKMIR